MEKLKPGTFAGILKKNRSRYNTLFSVKGRGNARVDGEKFSRYIRTIIGPLMELIEGTDEAGRAGPGALEAMVDALYVRILDLCAGDYLGSARRPYFDDVFIPLTRAFWKLLLHDTDAFLSGLVSAIIRVAAVSPTAVKTWSGRLLALDTGTMTIDDFRTCGFIAAWVSGMASCRERALHYCEIVPPGTFFTLMGTGPDARDGIARDDVLFKLKASPWAHPCGEAEPGSVIVRPVGGFRGYRGVFTKPPVVYVEGDEIIASDGASAYAVCADIFGHSIRAVEPDTKKVSKLYRAGSPDKGPVYPDSLVKNSPRFPKDFMVPVLAHVITAGGLCFTSPLSHRVFFAGEAT